VVGPVAHRFTDRRQGDLAVTGDPGPLAARRAAVAPGPWTWLHQVHGADVVVVTEPGQHAGAEADAAVSATPGAVLAVHSADCAPLLLVGAGTVGVVHAGWRGLVGGVVEAAAAAMADLGGPPVEAVLGPCIRARCYEFGPAELAAVADRYGPGVEARTAWGTPALDVGAAVAEACGRLGVPLVDQGTCTACSPRHWSHRARSDAERQALVAWLVP
jgi:YfiH family protein